MPTTWKISRWSEVFENHKTREKPGMKMKRLQSPIDFLGIGYSALMLMDDREALYGCWSVTAMVAAQCSPRGVLIRNDGSPHTPKTVALIARMRPEVMEIAWAAFREIGWLLPQDEESGSPPGSDRPIIAPLAPHHRPLSAPSSPQARRGRAHPGSGSGSGSEEGSPLSPPTGGAGGSKSRKGRKTRNVIEIRREGPPYDPCEACENGAVWDRTVTPPIIVATCKLCARGRDRAKDIRASREGERSSEARRVADATIARTLEPGKDPEALGGPLTAALETMKPEGTR